MRKKPFLLFLFLLASAALFAQVDSAQAKPDKPAEFKGGIKAWISFLEQNLDHDLIERNQAPAGKYTTLASFIVDSTGGIRDIKIEKDPGYGAAGELIRILKKSSKNWVPAMNKGIPVSYIHRQSLTLISRG